jgi:hypothetical protein
MAYWNSLSNQQQVLETARRNGAVAIVAYSSTNSAAPAGWEHVPGTNFFLYPLNR